MNIPRNICRGSSSLISIHDLHVRQTCYAEILSQNWHKLGITSNRILYRLLKAKMYSPFMIRVLNKIYTSRTG